MIDITTTAKYYAIFYFAAFAIAFLLKLIEGKQRKFPWITWLALSIFAQTLFVIGTKAVTISFADWQMAFQTLQLPNTMQRSLLGGILSFVVVYFVARYYLKFKNDFLDAMAIPSVIGLAIQRFGCFFGGCCFGTPTHFPWGVSYTAGSPAYFSQVDSGLISRFDSHSLPIHPTQLYYVFTGILIIGILLIFRPKIKAAGNLFVLTLSLFAFSRFVVEFFVDVHGNQVAGQLVFGLKVVQWVSVSVGAGLMFLFRYRERHSGVFTSSTAHLENDYTKSALLLLVSFVATFYCKDWFSIMELHLLRAMLLLSVGLIAVKVYAIYNKPYFRVAHSIMALLVLVLMSQTLRTERSVRSEHPEDEEIKTSEWSQSVGFGPALGQYQNSTNQLCDNTYYKNRIALANANYSFTKTSLLRPSNRHEYGVQLYLGQTRITSYKSNYQYLSTYDQFAIGVNPFTQHDFRFFGIGAGLLVSNYATFPLFNLPIIPQLGLRFGEESVCYFKANLFSNPIAGSNLPIISASVGSGFGEYNRNNLEIGYGASEYSDHVYLISASLLMSDNWKIKPAIVYGNSSNSSYSLGFSYSFK